LVLGLVALSLALSLALPALHAQTPPDQPAAGGSGPIPYTELSPYGANIFLHKEVEQVKIERTLQMAKDAGITILKQQFPWSEIEFQKGYFHDDKWNKSAWEKFDNIVATAERVGVQLVARIDHAPEWARAAGSGFGDAPRDPNDLADFVAAFLQHYQGRIKYIQVWNEPNLHYEWQTDGKVDPAAYTALLKTVYIRAKATDPNVVILSAPLAITLEDWPQDDPQYRRNLNELIYWDEMYQAGAQAYFDILAANAYGLNRPPADPPAPETLNFRRVELLRDIMVKHGDENKAIWFNEYAWNASPTTLAPEEQTRWQRVDPEVQAQYTVEGIRYARENWPWAGVFFIWYLRQVGDIPPDKAEYYFQMIDPEFNPQPVYNAVKEAATSAPPAQATATAAPPPAATATAPPAAATATAPPADATPTPPVVALTPIPPTPPVSGAPGAEGNPLVIWLIVGGVVSLSLAAGLSYYLLRRR
jgi:hypothetical protein